MGSCPTRYDKSDGGRNLPREKEEVATAAGRHLQLRSRLFCDLAGTQLHHVSEPPRAHATGQVNRSGVLVSQSRESLPIAEIHFRGRPALARPNQAERL